LADGDATRGNVIIGSPLGGAIVLRGLARCCAGDQAWKGDIETGQAMSVGSNVTQRGIIVLFKYGLTLPNGIALPDAAALQETAQMLELAERSGDDFTLCFAQYARGSTLVRHGGPQCAEGLSLLAAARDAALQERSSLVVAPMVDTLVATEKAESAICWARFELSRAAVEAEVASGDMIARAPATAVLVESLLLRGADGDLQEAQAAVDRLAAVPTEPGFVLHEIHLLHLRALLARARLDDAAYEDFRNRYRTMAESLGSKDISRWPRQWPDRGRLAAEAHLRSRHKPARS